MVERAGDRSRLAEDLVPDPPVDDAVVVLDGVLAAADPDFFVLVSLVSVRGLASRSGAWDVDFPRVDLLVVLREAGVSFSDAASAASSDFVRPERRDVPFGDLAFSSGAALLAVASLPA